VADKEIIKTEKKPDQGKGKKRTFVLSENMIVPVLAVLTGLIIGGLVIAITNTEAVTAWGVFFKNPGAAFKASWDAITTGYGALFSGSLGKPADMIAGIQNYFATGDSKAMLKAFYPFTESLVTATPYIFAGLAVALGFQGGLFNIGAEGQFYIGALASAYIGYSIVGLPWFIHLPLAILAGAAAGDRKSVV